MEKINRRKIGLGIIGIITIIVAVVGATFAYLSTRVTKSNISGQTYDISITLTVEKVNPASVPAKGNKLIPLNEADVATAISEGCVDENNYAVCQIYKLTFQNGESNSITMSGGITPSQNNYASLYYSTTAIGAAKDTLTTGTLITGNNQATTGFTNLIIPSGSSSMYLMLYIKNDISNNQQNDQGKTFIGTLTLIDNRSSNGRVQATFTINE